MTRGSTTRAGRPSPGSGHGVTRTGRQRRAQPQGGEALDAASIRAQLPQAAQALVTRLDTASSVGSTNAELLERPHPAPGSSEVLLAEYQTAGRGRRGRTWLAPPGGAICLSLSWTFREVHPALGSLGLVIGVCVLRVLRALGLQGAGLKWPNDILVGGKKLGGVLIELRAESTGAAGVVIGIGLNVALGDSLRHAIAATGLAATDLVSEGLSEVSRNRIAAAVIGECLGGLPEFARLGLKPFIPEWRDADALRGAVVSVAAPEGTVRGTARGIDLHGAFLLETAQGVRRFISGDVSVRP
ncbi:MAG: biotin--[acetyl-CoA-carboxylase] ligase [Proteobacteria bacterium]|nr:biotin--[acetyl-CoA-carboxylase] ligase [Pseudomonadota bacterium]